MPAERPIVEGLPVPQFLYGTAWKEDATRRLTEFALSEGFRGIDTANQRRHYHEAAVGEAVAAAISAGVVTREQLFLQTKYTFQAGQDHRLPYDPRAPISTQVEQSLASSLAHFGVERLDSFVLHGPSQRYGLSTADWEAWRAMESLHDAGRVRFLGVSNVTVEQLDALCQQARIRPRFVQNRCFAVLGWDHDIRAYCSANGIVYQGFSLLTANRDVLAHREVMRMADRHGRSAAQIVFRFALHVGMLPLTGTSSAQHMREDLAVFDFQLDADEIARIETVAVHRGV